MRKTCLIFLLSFICHLSYCQDSFVTPSGDTITGVVENYREWSKNPAEVNFERQDGSKIILTPANCKSFKAGSDYYISYHGTRVVNNDNVIFSQGKDTSQEIKDTVNAFLRMVYHYDNYALYKLFDNKRINFYLAKNGNLRELEYYETVSDNAVQPSNIYKSYLYQEFRNKGVRHFDSKLRLLIYKENSLIDFLADVVKDQSHAEEKLRDKYPAETLVGIGGFENAGKITDLNHLFSYSQTSFAPSLDFGFRVYSQRNFGKFFFQPSLSFTLLNNTFDQGFFGVKASVLNVNLGAGYTFLKNEKLSLYLVGAGTLPILFKFETKKGNGNYNQSTGPEDRISVRPELGLVIGRKINIALSDMLPIKLPFFGPGTVDGTVIYQLTQTSLSIRYALIHGHK